MVFQPAILQSDTESHLKLIVTETVSPKVLARTETMPPLSPDPCTVETSESAAFIRCIRLPSKVKSTNQNCELASTAGPYITSLQLRCASALL